MKTNNNYYYLLLSFQYETDKNILVGFEHKSKWSDLMFSRLIPEALLRVVCKNKGKSREASDESIDIIVGCTSYMEVDLFWR